MKQCLCIFIMVYTCLLHAQRIPVDSLHTSSFTLVSGKKNKTIHCDQGISIYTLIKSGAGSDSLRRRYSANFIKLLYDTMYVMTPGYSEDRLYALPKDSSCYNSILFTDYSVVKIPLREITNIYYNRSLVQGATTVAGASSIVTALVIGPVVSIEKNGFNNPRFETIAGVSFGVLAAAIITGCGWGQKNYWLQPVKKHKRRWQIQSVFQPNEL